MIERGDVCWVGELRGGAPGTRSPAVVVQADGVDRPGVRTVPAA